MSDSSALPNSCPKCGAALPLEATDGLCPNCLMNEALQPTQVSDASKPKHSAILAPETLAPFFPQYEILRMLGRGGMGAVYLARQISLNRLVAIKILPSDLGESDQNFAERFKNEAQAMAQLSHAGIVAVYDFGQTTSGLLFIVMEYIDGTDVALMVTRQGRLPSAHAMAITAHVCDALAYAHGKGIIHRDIKPSNIMIGNDGVVKVADFGLAKMSQATQSSLTQSGMVMGTLHFMAPEALMLGSEVDQRADIYAVGVMLYQMLTGKLPQGLFEMPSLQVKGLDPRYDQIVAKALREDRDLRYPDANAMRHDLDAILTQPVVKAEAAPAQAPAAALPPAAQRTFYRPPPRQMHQAPPPRRSGFGVWAALFIIGGLAAIFFLGRDKTASEPTPAVTSTRPVATPAAPQPTPSSNSSTVTREPPFENTLGMKFVPVPIIGGPTNGQKVLFSIWETRNQDYEVFAKDTGTAVPTLTYLHTQSPLHPAMTVSLVNARKFCEWLTAREQKLGKITVAQRYRLPTDHEWSCAAGIGDLEDASASPASKRARLMSRYAWGTAFPPPPKAGNYKGEEAAVSPNPEQHKFFAGYRDDHAVSAPVGSYPPNAFGLYDLGGNAWEWCDEPMQTGDPNYVWRGGGYLTHTSVDMLSSYRVGHLPTESGDGFRVVLASAPAREPNTLSNVPAVPAPPANGVPITAATKEQPFENSLGMKFVPVPITGGPTDGQRVLFSIWETRVKDYEVFVKEAQHAWANSSQSQQPELPAVKMSWEDAKTFCTWLTDRERKAGWLKAEEEYRLPSDHEWSCAVGIGDKENPSQSPEAKSSKINGVYPWGTGYPPPAGVGNYHGEETEGDGSFPALKGYRDEFKGISPVGRFQANALGLFDLGGNVWEFCADLHASSKPDRVMRGATFNNRSSRDLNASFRIGMPPTDSGSDKGFRIVLATNKKTTSPVTPIPIVATDPSTNTLGMKFAPLPGTKVSMCIHETRRSDYAAFSAAVPSASAAWKSTAAADNHPVTNVSWEDAAAFCAWLSKKENRRYRLPTDREWSIAAGIAAQESASAPPFKLNGAVAGVYPWSKAKIATVKAGNYAGAGDVYEQTAPVMSFPANELGFFDLGGNVWEYCADLFSPSATTRVLRGASWMDSDPAALLSSCRDPVDPSARGPFVGFRVVLEGPVLYSTSVTPVIPSPATQPADATKGIRPDKVKYTNKAGAVEDRHAWKGKQTAVLTVSDSLDAAVMTRLVGDYDRVYDYYREITGREPRKPSDVGNLAVTAEDDTSASGMTTVVGLAKTWVKSSSFKDLLKDFSERGEHSVTWFREFGLNTWYYAPQLAPSGVGYIDAFPSGYCVLMHTMATRKLGLKIPLRRGSEPSWEKALSALLDSYLADSTANFTNTLAVGKAPANAASFGGAELFAAFGLRLCDDHGGDAFLTKLWQEVGKAQPAKSAQDGIDTFILAACAAADKDLSSLFTTQWRWPISPAAQAKASKRWKTSGLTPATTSTKTVPFINSLGMKFVPVPIKGGATDKKLLLFSIWPTRSKDYQAFTSDTQRNWAAPNFQQTPEHPAVLISWEDARAFCDWLTARERKSGILKAGQVYRLPTDHEWSCGVGIGDKEDASKPPMEKSGKISREFPWGKRWPPPDNAGNYTDRTAEKWQKQNKGSLFKDFITSLEDGYVQTSPVGSFPANTFGLYDMGGNVWNWCEDVYSPDRTERTMRGAAWFAWDEISLLSSNRIGRSPTAFYDTVGFRCVLDDTTSP